MQTLCIALHQRYRPGHHILQALHQMFLHIHHYRYQPTMFEIHHLHLEYSIHQNYQVQNHQNIHHRNLDNSYNQNLYFHQYKEHNHPNLLIPKFHLHNLGQYSHMSDCLQFATFSVSKRVLLAQVFASLHYM